MDDKMKKLDAPPEEEEQRAYTKPTLTRYGDVESLTAGAPGNLTADQSSFTTDGSTGR